MKNRKTPHAGFTLIELMVSIAILAILMSAVFYMLKVGDKESEKAKTLAKLEHLNTLITAYHSQYGVYPPVPVYPIGNASATNDGTASTQPHQPINFRVHIDGPSTPDASTGKRWDQISAGERFVTFGLLSYFYPRGTIFNSLLSPSYKSFFQDAIDGDAVQLGGQFDPELSSLDTLATEELADPRMVSLRRQVTDLERQGIIKAGTTINVETGDVWYNATVESAWGDIWYAAVPPYQGYTLWSAGPNGKTCRECWLGTCPKKDTDQHKNWIADDLGKFDK